MTAAWTGPREIAPSANLESAARAAVANADSPRELAERLLATTPEGGFGRFTTGTDPRDLTRPFTLTGTWHSPHGVTFNEDEAYITVPVGLDLDPPLRLRALLANDGPRRHPLVTAARDFRWDTVVTVPAGLVVTHLPADVAFHDVAGSYTATYERTGRDIAVTRRLVIDRAVFAASDYKGLESLVYAAINDTRAVVALARAEALEATPSLTQ